MCNVEQMKKYWKSITVACSCLLMAGCGLYKPYERPDAIARQMDSADELMTAGLPQGNATGRTSDDAPAAAVCWRDVFTDPALQALVDTALKYNTDLRISELRMHEAEEALRTARLSLLPSLNVSAEGSTADFASFATSLGGKVSWQVDAFAGLTNTTRKAKAALMESQDYEKAVRTQLIAEVVGLWYSLALLREQRAVTAETAALWSETIGKTSAMKEAGLVTDAALAQYEGTYWQTVSSVADYDYNITLAENNLRSLLCAQGMDFDLTPSASASLALKGEGMNADGEAGSYIPAFSFSDEVDGAVLARRPDVRMAEDKLIQAYYGTAIARASLYPSLTLTGNAATDFSPIDIASQVAAAVAQPVFNAGANRARVKVAKLQQEEALLNFQQTLCDAALEINNSLWQLSTARTKADNLAQQVASLERAAESTGYLMQYGTSGTTYLDVLTARRSLLSARLAQLSNRYTELSATIALYKACGGDDDLIDN